MEKTVSKLNPRKKYLQISLNHTLEEAKKIIQQIPLSDRILIEVGTPLIKRYGEKGIREIKRWYVAHLHAQLFHHAFKSKSPSELELEVFHYVVADLKMMDRGETEAELAARAGADAAIALGHAPIESLNAFIQKCEELGLDAMVDMMNVEYPLSILRQLKKLPRVVILHRGVDEERFNKEKQIPFHEIKRIKSNYDLLVAVAGGDTLQEVQRSIFNDADIVIIWKSFFQSTGDIAQIVKEFLKEIK